MTPPLPPPPVPPPGGTTIISPPPSFPLSSPGVIMSSYPSGISPL